MENQNKTEIMQKLMRKYPNWPTQKYEWITMQALGMSGARRTK